MVLLQRDRYLPQSAQYVKRYEGSIPRYVNYQPCAGLFSLQLDFSAFTYQA